MLTSPSRPELGWIDRLTLDGYESLDRLEKDGQAKGEKENSVKKCTQELSTCPTEREGLGGLGLF